MFGWIEAFFKTRALLATVESENDRLWVERGSMLKKLDEQAATIRAIQTILTDRLINEAGVE